MSHNAETDPDGDMKHQHDLSNHTSTSSDQNMFCLPNENKLQSNNGHDKTPSGIVVINDLERSMSLVSWKEMKVQACLAGPIIMGNLLSFLLQMVSLTFVGHCGKLELSGASIANSFAIVTGFSVVVCLSINHSYITKTVAFPLSLSPPKTKQKNPIQLKLICIYHIVARHGFCA